MGTCVQLTHRLLLPKPRLLPPPPSSLLLRQPASRHLLLLTPGSSTSSSSTSSSTARTSKGSSLSSDGSWYRLTLGTERSSFCAEQDAAVPRLGGPWFSQLPEVQRRVDSWQPSSMSLLKDVHHTNVQPTRHVSCYLSH